MQPFKIIQEWSFIEQTKKYFQVKQVINKIID